MSIGNPYIGFKNQGRDYNFFQEINVTWSAYGQASANGQEPDIVLTCPTGGVSFWIEGTGSSVIGYSFNGNTTHGKLIQQPSSVSYTQPRSYLEWDDRVISMIWFQLISGGAATVAVEAWGHQ